MPSKLYTLIIIIPLMYFLIFIHECGHFFFGRILGIPAKIISINIFDFTPHVVLKNKENHKISPKNIESYIEILNTYFKTDKQYFFFVCSGHLFELIAVFVIFLTYSLFPNTLSKLLIKLIPISLYLSLVYLIIDLFISKYKNTNFGDFSSLYSINKKCSIAFYLGYFSMLLLMNILLLIWL